MKRFGNCWGCGTKRDVEHRTTTVKSRGLYIDMETNCKECNLSKLVSIPPIYMYNAPVPLY